MFSKYSNWKTNCTCMWIYSVQIRKKFEAKKYKMHLIPEQVIIPAQYKSLKWIGIITSWMEFKRSSVWKSNLQVFKRGPFKHCYNDPVAISDNECTTAGMVKPGNLHSSVWRNPPTRISYYELSFRIWYLNEL